MKTLLTVIFFLLLLACSVKDIQERRIPNQYIIVIFIIGIINGWIFSSFFEILTGIIVPSLFLLIIYYKWNYFMGAGDIKLLAAIGAWVGGLANIYVLLVGCILALIYVGILKLFRYQQGLTSVPFAPFLSLATIIIYVCAGIV